MMNEEIFLLEPWIFSGTIRQNILFGLDYDPQKFNRCIHLAALNTVRIF
jgi:ABC-type multidrug transport system fused ATPase/permease subunit